MAFTASATIFNCSRAAGRYTSTETSSGRCPPFLNQFASLPEVVVLPEPCSPAISTTVGGCEANFTSRRVLAEDLDQFIAHNLDDLLARRQRRQHFLADGLGLNVVDQLLDDFEVDVGLKQRQPDLASAPRRCSPRSAWPVREGS